MKPSKNRLTYIDVLRASLMLYIVGFWHVTDYAGNMAQCSFTRMLLYGVLNTFVFMSGYVLSYRYKRLATADEFKMFLIKRVLRIYPLYVIALLMFGLVVEITTSELISHLMLVNMFADSSILTLWFIGLIFNYYIIFAIACYKTSIRRLIVSSAVFLSLSLIMALITGGIDRRIVLYYPAFVMGIVFARHADSLSFIEKTEPNCVLIITAAVLLLGAERIEASFPGKMFLFGGGVALILPFVQMSKAIARHLSKRATAIFAKISYASFCMYLFHRTIYSIFLKIYDPTNQLHMVLFLSTIGLPSIIFVSYGIQHCYDSVTRQIICRRTVTAR